MPAFHALSYSRTAYLKALSCELLTRLLVPFADYFKGRDFAPDVSQAWNDSDYDKLASILGSPDSDTPDELTEALFLITQTAQSVNRERLVDCANEAGVSLDANDCDGRIALKFWLSHPEGLKDLYAENSVNKARSFEYFSSEEEVVAPFHLPSPKVIELLQKNLCVWFAKHGRGEGCKIQVYPKGHEVWFLLLHGDRFQRVGTWEDGNLGIIGYRPDKQDVVVFDSMTNELRIHAGTATLRELYRSFFGFYLFGREKYFPGINKYTLDPILKDGSQCLYCQDVPGIRNVQLVKLVCECFDKVRYKISLDCKDMFKVLEGHTKHQTRLLAASFSFQVTNSHRARNLIIKPSNVALYSRDEDSSLIEEWIKKRGFTGKTNTNTICHEQKEFILEFA